MNFARQMALAKATPTTLLAFAIGGYVIGVALRFEVNNYDVRTSVVSDHRLPHTRPGQTMVSFVAVHLLKTQPRKSPIACPVYR